MKILISGASGYLGSQLARYLSSSFGVVSLVRSTSIVERLNEVKCEQARFTYLEDLPAMFEHYRPDIVINTVCSYGRKGESLSDIIASNISFPVRLLEAANDFGVKAFINCDSSLPSNVNVYAKTKSSFVEFVDLLTTTVKFVNVRLEHFYGPQDDNSKFVSYVIDKCKKGEDLDLTDGVQERDFIYIDDVLSAFECIIRNMGSIAYKESISLGSGEAPTVRHIVELIRSLANSNSRLNFGAVQRRSNELMYSCADVTRLNDLGWNKKYSLKKGILASL